MDPERQPLLNPAESCVYNRHGHRRRALTYEEVVASQTVAWSRARCWVVVAMWCALATMLTMVVGILLSAGGCHNQMPSVPPVHLSFTPLVQAL